MPNCTRAAQNRQSAETAEDALLVIYDGRARPLTDHAGLSQAEDKIARESRCAAPFQSML
jgi:hypothetical protein